MFVELTKPEKYRGKEYEKGDIIEVGGALGDSLILNGHKMASSAEEVSKVKILSDEEIDALAYKDAQKLIKKLKVETADKKLDTYKAALKDYFSNKRGE